MKKIAFILFFLCCTSFAFSQEHIPDTFFGCKLGVSTVDDVRQALEAHGFVVGNSSTALLFDYKWNGIMFDAILFSYHQGVLSGITLSISDSNYFLTHVHSQALDTTNLQRLVTYASQFRDLPRKYFQRESQDSFDSPYNMYLEARLEGDLLFDAMCQGRSAMLSFHSDFYNASYDWLHQEDLSDRNIVIGVAGCLFGSSKQELKLHLQGRYRQMTQECYDVIRYSGCEIGGLTYESANFFFGLNEEGQQIFTAANLYSSFSAQQYHLAQTQLDKIVEVYRQKYTNVHYHKDFDGAIMYQMGRLVDRGKYPITICLRKLPSTSGQEYWYVVVSYNLHLIPSISSPSSSEI